jgi:hypothetical protein
MSTKTATKSTKSSSCRCGCSGKTPSGGSNGCTCDQCAPACPDSGVLRPNFFAGQLLTEDDLQQITIYQNGKRRLTNRYVFGTGVVCGLEVCPGDTPGTVIVKPGYALDCCGNDIVLSCPYPIDVNEMIRDQGLDCGAPCPDPRGNPDGVRTYLLCVQYAECLSEPVSPYSPGATSTACVNTRVQESCTFKLRFPPKICKPQDDLAAKLRDLLEEKKYEFGLTYDLARWDELTTSGVALSAANIVTLTAADEADLALITDVNSVLPEALLREKCTEDNWSKALEAFHGPARTVARFYFVPAASRWASGSAGRKLTDNKQLEAAKAVLATAVEKLNLWVRASFPAAAQTEANLLIDQTRSWTGAKDETALDDLRKRIDLRLFIRDNHADAKPYSLARYAKVVTELAPTFGWVAPVDDDFTAPVLKDLVGRSATVRNAFERDSRSKICEALNPPCAPCDDLCVLLATVEVKACKVGPICNLVRNIILSPTALGYWLPLQDLLAKLCCCPTDGGGRELWNAALDPFQKAAALLFPKPPPEENVKKAEGAKS